MLVTDILGLVDVLSFWGSKGQRSRSQQTMTKKPCEHYISQPSKGNLRNFDHRCISLFVFVDVLVSFVDRRSRSPLTRKTGRIQYLRKYFHQNSVMYVPASETY